MFCFVISPHGCRYTLFIYCITIYYYYFLLVYSLPNTSTSLEAMTYLCKTPPKVEVEVEEQQRT